MPTRIPSGEADRLTPPEAAAALALSYPGTFNRLRRKLQKIYCRETRSLKPFPTGLAGAQERALAREHILVVPEWGGVSWYSTDWTYSRRACESWGAAEYASEIGVRPPPAE